MKIAHLSNSPFTRLSKAIADDILTLPGSIPKHYKTPGNVEQSPKAIEKLVDLNYKRRKIRLPWLYGNKFSRSIYQSLKRREFQNLYQYYLKELKAFNPDVVLIWNGSLMPGSVLKQAAIALGIQITYFEHGFFPDTIQVDNKGINGFNSVPTDAAFYKKLSSRYDEPFKSKLNTRQQKNSATSSQKDIPFDTYIFVPMQVPSDMQILELSPWVEDMRHLYEILSHAADKNSQLNFVIKEHPSFKLSIQKQIKPHKQLKFANAAVTETLIEHADAVITINSTVGIETITKQKPLISLGTAYYNIDGITAHSRNAEELNEHLKIIHSSTAEPELRNRFLNFIKNTYLISGSLKELSEETIQSIRNRILERDDFHQSMNRDGQRNDR